jgi:hypothetical protein
VVRALDWGAEADDIAVGIDHDAFMLPPLGVLRTPHVHAGRRPDTGQLIGIVDEQIRGRRGGRSIDGSDAQVDLAAIKSRETVAAAFVGTGHETKSGIVCQGDPELADREYRGDPNGGNHVGNDSDSSAGDLRPAMSPLLVEWHGEVAVGGARLGDRAVGEVGNSHAEILGLEAETLMVGDVLASPSVQ